MVIKVKIKRFDKSLSLPAYQTKGAACLDLYCRQQTTIPPGEVKLVPLNVALEIPEDCWVMIVARSSTHKLGLLMVNGLAVGDRDFCGNDDEYYFPAFNFTKKPVVVKKGVRIAQMMVMSQARAVLEEVDQLTGKNRGSFGTTGGLRK